MMAYKLAGVVVLGVVLSGCGGEAAEKYGKKIRYEFEVTITNLTASQPLSPSALIFHNPNWHVFKTGEAASLELEQVAEAGDNQMLLDSAYQDKAVQKTESGSEVLLPGATERYQIRLTDRGRLQLSYVSMLVNTNDAFAALDALQVSDMAVGDSLTRRLISYDSGTEANSETADSVPGPASSGLAEGFNPARDDIRNQVYVHPGVITSEDGLSNSVLKAAHRWDNPVASITVIRLD